MTELTISDMPPEVLCHLFRFCAQQDLFNLLLVKVEGSCILGELSNLTHLDLSDTEVHASDLETICSSMMQLDTLIFIRCHDGTGNLGNMACSYIANQISLRKLNMEEVKSEGYHHLSKLKNLKCLNLSCTDVNGEDLRTICSSTMELESLKLNGCHNIGEMAHDMCSYISNQTSLRTLSLEEFEAEGYHCFEKLVNLKDLNLSFSQITDSDLETICSSSIKLTSLQLRHCSIIGHMACQYISTQTSLIKLDISGVQTEGYHHFRMLENLKYLDLSLTEVKDLDLEAICCSSIELDTLILIRCHCIGNLACSYISSQTSLINLHLEGVEIVWYHHLRKLKNLKNLDLSLTDVKDSDLEQICTSSMKLNTLSLISCDDIGDMVCSYIANQTSLKQLDLEGVEVAGYHHLAKLNDLKDLDLTYTLIDDSDLEAICSSTMKLDSLKLIACHRITNTACQHITKQTSLRKLEISGKHFEGYDQLEILPNLKDLDLGKIYR